MEKLWKLNLIDEKKFFLTETEHHINESRYDVYGAFNRDLLSKKCDRTGVDIESVLFEYSYIIPSEVIISYNSKKFYSLVYEDDTEAEHEFKKWLIKFKVSNNNIKYELKPVEIFYFEYYRTLSERNSYGEEIKKYFNNYYKYKSSIFDRVTLEGDEAKKKIENELSKITFIVYPVETDN